MNRNPYDSHTLAYVKLSQQVLKFQFRVFLTTYDKVYMPRQVLGMTQFHVVFQDIWRGSSWNNRSLGTTISQERKFLEGSLLMNVSSTAAKVPRSEYSTERMFSLWTFRSREQKWRGTKSHGFWVVVVSNNLLVTLITQKIVVDRPLQTVVKSNFRKFLFMH